MTTRMRQTDCAILTALAGERRHGYSLLGDIRSTGGHARVATLYAALERLRQAGLVAADGEEIVDGRARRYFRLTDLGAEALADEVRRLDEDVRRATERLRRHASGVAAEA